MRRGQKTRIFERHKLMKGPYSEHTEESMSLIFERAVHNFGKYRLFYVSQLIKAVFNTTEECDLWSNGLSLAVQEAKQADLIFL